MPAVEVWHSSPVGISVHDFGKLKTRLNEKKRAASPLTHDNSPLNKIQEGTILLGVDPSLRGTGFGIIKLATPHPLTLTHGTISCDKTWEHSRCLLKINEELRSAIHEYRPEYCIIEGLFFAQNIKTAIVMGQARGAAMVAAAEGGLSIYEIAPRKVKQAIVGYGAAQKDAVAKMVQRMLHLESLPAPDAADALALALTWSFEARGLQISSPKKI